jgi:hypothetical protein
MKTIDISGMGGGYEACCQAMFIAGFKWLNEHPDFTFEGYKAYKNVTGIMIPPKTQLAKELDDVLLKASLNDMTGAQHEGVISHLAYIKRHGYEGWLEDAQKNGREVIEVDEGEVQKELATCRQEWAKKLASGYNPIAEILKKVPADHVIYYPKRM